MASFRLWLALRICPYLLDELGALRTGNTKVVLENERLMDELDRYRALTSAKDPSR